jgi:superfamily II DNA or RNA helicase
MISLRPYQEEVIDEARVKLRKIKEALKRKMIDRGPRLLIQCPTGGGKTVMAAFICKGVVERGKSVAFNCHRDFLVDQTSKTFSSLGIDHSHVAAGRWYDPWALTHVNMVQTLGNRLKKVTAPSLCEWDECHHIAASTWAKIMEAWSASTHIGFSATPIRLDGKGLDAYFDDIVIGPSVSMLMEIGSLSDYRYFAPSSPDLTALHTRMGDYAQGEIDEEMGKAVVIGNLVEHYAKRARGLKAVYFCTSIKNSLDTAAAFNGAGFRFIHLDGNSSAWERKQAAQMLARNELDGMTNVDLFGEGFDLAAQAEMDVTIECVGLARPTQSLGLSRQMVGRALRPKDYPAIILDHAGHLQNHGLPDDPVEWSLKGAIKKETKSVLQCDGCGAALKRDAIKCLNCGATLELPDRKASAGGGERLVEFRDGELEEIDRKAARDTKKLEEWQAGSIGELEDIGKRRGYENPEAWAALMWKARTRREKAKGHAAKQQFDFYAKLMQEKYG